MTVVDAGLSDIVARMGRWGEHVTLRDASPAVSSGCRAQPGRVSRLLSSRACISGGRHEA